jgi:hypothetical protein
MDGEEFSTKDFLVGLVIFFICSALPGVGTRVTSGDEGAPKE